MTIEATARLIAFAKEYPEAWNTFLATFPTGPAIDDFRFDASRGSWVAMPAGGSSDDEPCLTFRVHGEKIVGFTVFELNAFNDVKRSFAIAAGEAVEL